MPDKASVVPGQISSQVYCFYYIYLSIEIGRVSADSVRGRCRTLSAILPTACVTTFCSRSTRERVPRAPSVSPPPGRCVAVEQQSFEQIYPASGWVEHDAEVIWATVMSTSRRVLQRLGAAAAAGCRHRHHQSARDHHSLGSAQRRAHLQCHRLAGSPHRRSMPAIGSRSRRGRHEPQDRPALRSVFFGHQDRVDSRPRAGCARGRGRRPHCLRHRRQLSHLATERRHGCISRMPRMPAAPRSTTSARAVGTRRCARCSTCP